MSHTAVGRRIKAEQEKRKQVGSGSSIPKMRATESLLDLSGSNPACFPRTSHTVGTEQTELEYSWTKVDRTLVSTAPRSHRGPQNTFRYPSNFGGGGASAEIEVAPCNFGFTRVLLWSAPTQKKKPKPENHNWFPKLEAICLAHNQRDESLICSCLSFFPLFPLFLRLRAPLFALT